MEVKTENKIIKHRPKAVRLFVSRDILRKLPKWTEKMGPIKTYARNSMILPDFVGKSFEVHNGKSFLKINVTADMIGTKLGEYVPTRKFKGHSGKAAKVAKR